MLNLAKLFVLRGVGATILATPTATPFLRDTVDRARDCGYSINLLLLPSSSNGAENLTSPEMSPEFFTALESFRQPLDRVLREHRPSCIVSDMFMPFTEEVANALNIPRLVFHSMGFFPLCVMYSVDRSISNGSISSTDDDKDTIVVPGLPHRMEMKRSQLHNSTGARNGFSEFMERVKESELKSYGAVVNSFYELEPEQYLNIVRLKD
uniref:Uncharacterized protein n=1 Tax=Ananas comosus var. bracteatus TaxID=296719 RepID=A0A6V7PU16_ANACO|nr:unnamed protein product [Ananas comosus var. bracteatus]